MRLRRFIYTLTMYLLTPVILYRLAVRGLRYPEYFARWRERFGFFPHPEIRDSVWIHAVSLGEVNAAMPLIDALMQRYQNTPFVITTVTPTGSERVRRVYGERVFNVYLPYDLPASIRRFLDRVRPRLAVVMETEIWPNLFFECQAREIPLIVANARLSEKSLRGYGPVRPLAQSALASARYVAAQSNTDAGRLRDLGAEPERLGVFGNLKYDMTVPAELESEALALRAEWGAAAAGVDRGEHARRRGDAGAERACGGAAPLSRCAAARRAAPSRALQAGRAGHVAVFGFRTRTRSEDGTPRRKRSASSSIRWANCCASMRRPMSPSSAAVSCRSAATTCSSPPRSACR